MAFRKPGVVIAALSGGAGKTSISLGLAAAWNRYGGLRVVPFKKGPDYIDAGWLAMAAGRPCYNLDPFLMESGEILDSFAHRAEDADICLIEGNRGLYDGVDVEGSCSTANLAKLLGMPVVLVLDATKVTRTAAALVLGCQHLDPEVRIAGVILNRVAGKRHETVLRAAIERECGVPVVGVVPKQKRNFFPERHMGLVPPQEHGDFSEALERVAAATREYLDLDVIRRIADTAGPLAWHVKPLPPPQQRLPVSERPVVGVVVDSAFQFYYPENLESLREHGAVVQEICSLDYRELPAVDALYIGGGFPETHAQRLADNDVFRDSLRERIEGGLPVYAECGGLMVLCETMHHEGRRFPMIGALPFEVIMERKPQGHGYTVMHCVEQNPFYPEGLLLKGHEFHYSRLVPTGEPRALRYAFRLEKGHGIVTGWDGVCYKNVLAAYSHVHAVGNGHWAQAVLGAAHRFRERRRLTALKTGSETLGGISDGPEYVTAS